MSTPSGPGALGGKASTPRTVQCESFTCPQASGCSSSARSFLAHLAPSKWKLCPGLVSTGITAECQQTRSQLQNRDTAMRVLRARLYQSMMGKEAEQRLTARKQQASRPLLKISHDQMSQERE